MKTTPVFLSRSFVEFGPFSVDEMKNFYSRGLLQEIDHIRPHGGDQWFHVMDWINSLPATESTAPKPATKKAAPVKQAAPSAKKAAPAKKAAAKKTTSPGKKAAPKKPKV